MKHLRIFYLTIALIFFCSFFANGENNQQPSDRDFWISTMTKIADPVLINLSQNTLKKNMPVEVFPVSETRNREKSTHLEAVGRLMCGIAPWLELGEDNTPEGKFRKRYIDLSVKSLTNMVNPKSADKLDFSADKQALVDAAFLAEAFLRAPNQLWKRLDKKTQERMIASLKETRKFKPNESNWLLFSAMVEAMLLNFTGECEMQRIDYALKRFDEWYKGDAWYGDGPAFHFDYYNSLVIHPMLIDILDVLKKRELADKSWLDNQTKRSIRYAESQERLISPEGTYPAIGRSLAYRFGVFHSLAQTALRKELPSHIVPAQVRSALTLVLKNQISIPGTFDKNNWLQLGFGGHQPEVAESYISTGSLYLCAAVFLPLGLPAEDEFWSAPYAEWTNKKAWSGKELRIDAALKN